MQTKLAPKKQREEFLLRIQILLIQLGAEPDYEEFILQTKVGKLTCHARENQAEGLGAVYCRFDCPNLARSLVDCNPCSGKWNHYYFSGWTVEAAIDDFLTKLEPLVPD